MHNAVDSHWNERESNNFIPLHHQTFPTGQLLSPGHSLILKPHSRDGFTPFKSGFTRLTSSDPLLAPHYPPPIDRVYEPTARSIPEDPSVYPPLDPPSPSRPFPSIAPSISKVNPALNPQIGQQNAPPLPPSQPLPHLLGANIGKFGHKFKRPCNRKCYRIRDFCSRRKACCLGIRRTVLSFDLCARLFPDRCRCNQHENTPLSSGSGYALFRLNVYEDFPTTQVQFYVQYCKLSSRVTSVTLRGPVDNCRHIGRSAIALGLISAAVNPNLQDYVYGGAYVTCEQTRDILLGRYYISVSTVAYPACEGEIRGALHCTELPRCGYNCVGVKVKHPILKALKRSIRRFRQLQQRVKRKSKRQLKASIAPNPQWNSFPPSRLPTQPVDFSSGPPLHQPNCFASNQPSSSQPLHKPVAFSLARRQPFNLSPFLTTRQK